MKFKAKIKEVKITKRYTELVLTKHTRSYDRGSIRIHHVDGIITDHGFKPDDTVEVTISKVEPVTNK